MRTRQRPGAGVVGQGAGVRIVHVITGLGTGGAETALCRLLESLRAPDFEHVVIALGGPAALSARVAAVAELHHLGISPGRLRMGDVWRLRHIIRAAAADVVHGWMYHANIASSLASVGLGVPEVWGIRHSIHALSNEKRSTRMVIRGGAWLSRMPRHIVYNSLESSRQHEAAGYASAKTRVVPNGFDTSAFRPETSLRERVRAELAIPHEALLIGLVARVHPVKDHANFLNAAALFVAGCPQAHFILVGDGADAGNTLLAGLIDTLGLRGHVRLCGRRTDVVAINAALDIATSSSWSEAFPNTIGEAMACGVPCVATDVGDVREIIGDTGVVVPPRDAPALAEGWTQLANLDAPARQALGLRARQRVIERYSLGAVSGQYAGLYLSLKREG